MAANNISQFISVCKWDSFGKLKQRFVKNLIWITHFHSSGIMQTCQRTLYSTASKTVISRSKILAIVQTLRCHHSSTAKYAQKKLYSDLYGNVSHNLAELWGASKKWRKKSFSNNTAKFLLPSQAIIHPLWKIRNESFLSNAKFFNLNIKNNYYVIRIFAIENAK